MSNQLYTDNLQANIITNIEGCSFKITSQSGVGWGGGNIFTVDKTGLLKWRFVDGFASGEVTVTAQDGQEFMLGFVASLIDHCN